MLNRCLDTGAWKVSRVDAAPDGSTTPPPGQGTVSPVRPEVFVGMMVVLTDGDGDGAVSLEEMNEANIKVFKQVDANGDGNATRVEIEAFFSPPTSGRN
jgi:hypothetical protein